MLSDLDQEKMASIRQRKLTEEHVRTITVTAGGKIVKSATLRIRGDQMEDLLMILNCAYWPSSLVCGIYDGEGP